MAAMRQRSTPVGPMGPQDYAARLVANLAHLIDMFGTREAARITGHSEQGLVNIKEGASIPRGQNLIEIACHLGASPEDLFDEPKLFAEKWTPETVNPFFRQSRFQGISSHRSLESSAGDQTPSIGSGDNGNGIEPMRSYVKSDTRKAA